MSRRERPACPRCGSMKTWADPRDEEGFRCKSCGAQFTEAPETER